jgi:predicted metal-dependent hydrolase
MTGMVFGLLKKKKKKKSAKTEAGQRVSPRQARPAPPRAGTDIPAEVAGLRVKPSARARYLNLRLDARASEIILTWPLGRRVSLAKAERFVAENREWIERQQRDLPQAQSFAPGVVLSLAGRDYLIEHQAGRGLTRLAGGKLLVHGRLEHLPRRVRDFVRQYALETMRALAHEKAAMLGLPPSEVRVLDPKTRWGSCGPDGKIMFSWRLILAPPDVMDYLVAHEVAHRLHMNHGRRFWKLCAQLAVAPSIVTCRRWLHENGKTLMVWS